MRTYVTAQNWGEVRANLDNLSVNLHGLNQLALSERYSTLALHLAEGLEHYSMLTLPWAEGRDSTEHLFRARLHHFGVLAIAGRWDESEEMWNLLHPMGRDLSRNIYRPGEAELSRLTLMLLPQGRLTVEDLAATERLARAGQNRAAIRGLHRLRGEWRLARGEHALAAESLQDAIRMAREAGFPDPKAETMLALARFHLRELPDAREEALRLSAGRDPAHLALARLWHAVRDTQQTAKHAKAAYRHAWGDGEPHVRRYALDRAKTLLQQLGEDIPRLPAYDPDQHPKKTLGRRNHHCNHRTPKTGRTKNIAKNNRNLPGKPSCAPTANPRPQPAPARFRFHHVAGCCGELSPNRRGDA